MDEVNKRLGYGNKLDGVKMLLIMTKERTTTIITHTSLTINIINIGIYHFFKLLLCTVTNCTSFFSFYNVLLNFPFTLRFNKFADLI